MKMIDPPLRFGLSLPSSKFRWSNSPSRASFLALGVAVLLGVTTGCPDTSTGPGPEPEPSPGPVSPEPSTPGEPFDVETIALDDVKPLNGRGLVVGVRSTGDWAVGFAVTGTEVVECQLFGGTTVESATEVLVQVATPTADGVQIQTVDGIPYAAQHSIDLAVDDDDTLVFAYAGGEPANGYCGPSDLVVSRETGNGTFAVTTVQTDSATPNGCRNDENGPETICQIGDTVGHYAAIAIHNGEVAVSFQDIHNGFAETDFSRADLELARGTNGFTVESVSPGTGAGFYSDVAFSDDGRVIVASRTDGNNDFVDANGNAYSIDAGIWVSVEQPDGTFAETLVADGGLTTTRVAVGAHPVAGFVVAFHDSLQDRLLLAKSATGEAGTFQIAPVDQIGLTGRSPSIAFTDDGRIVLAYRYCAGPGASACEAANDGVRVALQTDTGWRLQTVPGDDEDLEGIATHMAKGPNDSFYIVSHNTSRDHAVLHKLTLR